MPHPTIMLANVQSLHGKIHDLQANVKYLDEYKRVCVWALTETWLKDHDLRLDLEIEGFCEPIHLGLQGDGYITWWRTLPFREQKVV